MFFLALKQEKFHIYESSMAQLIYSSVDKKKKVSIVGLSNFHFKVILKARFEAPSTREAPV